MKTYSRQLTPSYDIKIYTAINFTKQKLDTLTLKTSPTSKIHVNQITWAGLVDWDFGTFSPHTFNGPLSGTNQVSQYQKGKTNLDFTEARDSEWQWHQLGHMQICTLLQTDNDASTPPLSFFYRLDALPTAEPTASKHWRRNTVSIT